MRSALFALSLVALTVVMGAEPVPYLGEWSNGRGETLVVTRTTLQFANDKPVPYRDVTRATEGQTFELMITASGPVNAFSGKTIGLSCKEKSMTMTTFASHSAYMQENEPRSVVTWFKDS